MDSGGDLFSRAVTSQVSSALESLTAVFGMGTGVASPSFPPEAGVQALRHAPSRPHKEEGSKHGGRGARDGGVDAQGVRVPNGVAAS